jgi:6-phosphogluconolactonase
VDKDCRLLIASHYLSGNVTVFPLNEDGSLREMKYNYQHHGKSIDTKRQEAQHAHSTIFSPDEKIAYTADLGMDKIVLYKVDKEKGTIVPNDDLPYIKVTPGEGPRHFAFHPNGKYVYLTTEMGSSVIVYEYDSKTGNLEEKQKISTLPPSFTGMNLAADIHISGDGKYLYVSNRGHNSIAMYSVDPETGLISGGDYFPTLGNWSRFFAISPDGRFMIIANQLSDNATVFEIDPETGVLGEMIQNIKIPQPVCIAFY